MKSIRKTAVLVLILCCALALFACGEKKETTTTPAQTADTATTAPADEPTPADDATPTPSEETAAPEPTATSEVSAPEPPADKGTLKVGVKQDVAGFGLLDPLTNEYTGMEIDLAHLIADALGYSDVEFTTVTAATRGELLDSGDLDCVLATFTIKPDRKEKWDFSTPYYTDAVTVLVEKGSGISTLADLLDKKIGVSTSSTSAKAVVEALQAAGILETSDLESFVASEWKDGVSFVEFPDYPAISAALQSGEVDAFSVDKSILANYLTEDRQYIDETFSPQEYGVATKKGAALSAEIEALITTWLGDGTIQGLVDKYNLN